MFSLETLVGNGPEAGIVHEIIRRDMNPADVHEIDGQLVPYVLDVCGVDLLVVSGDIASSDNVTPEEFKEHITPRILRIGVDANIAQLHRNGSLVTVNKEKKPQICSLRSMPTETIRQFSASHAMTDRMKDAIIGTIPNKIGERVLTKQEKWVFAGHVMAKMAYGDKERASGKLYLTHPEDVAAISNYLLDELEKDLGIKIRPDMRAAFVIAALVHDTLEEWRKPNNYFMPSSPADGTSKDVLTPLTIKTTMMELGMGEHAADYLANAVRLMTHEKEGSWMLSFAQYLQRGCGNRLVAVTKLVDMFHNLTLEPKPVPIKKPSVSQQEYQYKVAYRNFHRGEYYYYLYDNGYLAIPYEKNAFHVDETLLRFNGRLLKTLQGLAYPDSPPKLSIDPFSKSQGKPFRMINGLTERQGRTLGSRYMSERMPEHRQALQNRYPIELAA